jgi:superfamily I DNA/RNA helicase
MTTQSDERAKYLNLILESKATKKLIVAGPGTGKTYTFKKFFNHLGPGNYLVLSFIRKLVDDLAKDIGDTAEVKTFHAFCKRILHEVQGKVDIYHRLTQIIQKDSELLGYTYSDFESKFRNLEEKAPEIEFYISRGDYYEHLCFDDSVYRLYRLLKDDESILDNYDHIIVDEYQDFNKLEVEFLKVLEEKGPILIVGDDDQAIYEGRSSSPDFLREKYNSGDYEIFELPYCSRCPSVIVEAVNEFIIKIINGGGLCERLEKQYFPFTEGNEELNNYHPKINIVTVPVIATIAKYIDVEISKIPNPDIIESNDKNNKYPTVLIIGQKHYLSELQKILKKKYPNIIYESKSSDDTNKVLDAIKILLKDDFSNLGWRIITEELQSALVLKSAVLASQKGLAIFEVIPDDFLEGISEILEIIKDVKKTEREFTEIEKSTILSGLKEYSEEVINYFSPSEEEEEIVEDPSIPTILLRTFEGSKGLSGGHVFIVGANNNSMPKINSDDTISDIECSKFIVALTRTRKQCHIISNHWLNSPFGKGKTKLPKFERSYFVGLIPSNLLNNLGFMMAKDIK